MTSRILIVAVAVAACGVALIAAGVCRNALIDPVGYAHPQPPGFRYHDDPWTKHRLAFNEVTLADDSCGAIRGWLVSAATGMTRAVVLLHGTGGDRTYALQFLPARHEAGATVLAIDLRESGLSDGAGRGSGLGMREAEDADRAVAELWRRGYRSIALMGFSLGATAAIIAGARNPQLVTVIAEDPVASYPALHASILRRRLWRFGLDAPAALMRWWVDAVIKVSKAQQGIRTLLDAEVAAGHFGPRPLLLVNGAADTIVPPSRSTHIFLAANGPKELVRVAGADHDGSFALAPQLISDKVTGVIRNLPERRP